MKALARFLELKGHKCSAANTKKKLGATTGFIACKKGGFLAGSTGTLCKIKPTPHLVTSLLLNHKVQFLPSGE